ncbi:MAG: DUF3592 domain-containing protein [Chloroflexus sp.]|uniref:DUF3592 domain-containing protein n=1 Tax=Chloroflexus sp. TaxID=1904827 RepID=UPI0021DDB2F9|nr:MAG: hypothetical protein KatS3mg056_2859 [Chloroflexus sp.]
MEFTTSTGQIVRFTNPLGNRGYYRGQEVTVLYDPENPEFAVIDSPVRWLSWIVPIGFGGVLVVLGIDDLRKWRRTLSQPGGLVEVLGLLLRRKQ